MNLNRKSKFFVFLWIATWIIFFQVFWPMHGRFLTPYLMLLYLIVGTVACAFIVRKELKNPKKKEEKAMPLCGFNPKMLAGLTMFSQGLYEQALKRQKEEGVSIERAFEIEVEEMNIFLTKLDEKYYKELRPKHSVAEAMDELVEWAASQPKG